MSQLSMSLIEEHEKVMEKKANNDKYFGQADAQGEPDPIENIFKFSEFMSFFIQKIKK